MNQRFVILSIMFLSTLLGCYQKPDFSDTPTLLFKAMNKDTMIQGFSKEDSIEFYFELTDGDGDIGFEDTDTLSKSILVKDLRTGNIAEQFKIPIIPENVVLTGLQAELQLKIYTTCCLFPDNIPPCSSIEMYPYDTLIYEMVIIDRAGNMSEPIQTPPITLICK